MSGRLVGPGSSLLTSTIQGLAQTWNDIFVNTGQRKRSLYQVRANIYGTIPVGSYTFYIAVTSPDHATVRDVLGLMIVTNNLDTFRTQLEWVSPVFGYGYEMMSGDVVTAFLGTAPPGVLENIYGFAVIG